jgi:3-dehydrosphinganine reductase
MILFAEVSPYGITVTVNCPPDTDTPGLKEEEKFKPEETKIISQAAGLFQPDVVAR